MMLEFNFSSTLCFIVVVVVVLFVVVVVPADKIVCFSIFSPLLRQSTCTANNILNVIFTLITFSSRTEKKHTTTINDKKVRCGCFILLKFSRIFFMFRQIFQTDSNFDRCSIQQKKLFYNSYVDSQLQSTHSDLQ